MGERIVRTQAAGLCTLVLNRPEKLNALDTLAFEELDAILADLEGQTDSIGCVVIRGEGRGFCAGADLGAIDAAPPGATPIDKRFKPRIVERLARLPQPVIAAVHGVCFTGGLELALACDFILADTSARFADTHGKWGYVGEWGMSQRLPRRIGLPAAKRMMLTSRIVTAEEAGAIGLADIVAPLGTLDLAIAEFSTAVLANSWHTNMHTKRILRETDGMGIDAALAQESYRYPGFAPDYRERLARFRKK